MSGLPPRAADLLARGLRRAEDGLGAFLGTPVAVEVDELAVAPALTLGGLALAPEQEVVAVYVAFGGDLTGHCLLGLPVEAAGRLAELLLRPLGAPAELADSALLEFGNLAVAGLVSGIADAGGWRIAVQPPVLARDMLGALLHTILAAASLAAGELIGLRARLRVRGERVDGVLLLLPDAASLRALAGAEGGPA